MKQQGLSSKRSSQRTASNEEIVIENVWKYLERKKGRNGPFFVFIDTRFEKSKPLLCSNIMVLP